MALDGIGTLIRDFDPLVGWVKAKVDLWHGRFISKRSKYMVIDSCLSSLPIYMMVLYILLKGVHGVGNRCMEKRKKFYAHAVIYPWRCIATRGRVCLCTLVDHKRKHFRTRLV